MRLFVAIHMEEEIIRALAEPVRRLQETRAAVRWVRPEAIHLTLKFLGETEPDRLPSISNALAAAAAGVLPFTIAVAGLGTFPGGRRPRVVWADIDEPTGTLARLHRNVEETLAGEGFTREKRRYSPHITLGRVKGNINLERLTAAAAALKDELWGRQDVDSVSLVRSRLSPAGAQYEDVGVFPLGR